MSTVLPSAVEISRASLTLTATNVFEAQKLWESRTAILAALATTGAEFECAELAIVVGQRLYATATGGRQRGGANA